MTGTHGNRRLGVFVCHCGTNIAGKVDVAKVAADAAEFGSVVHSCDYKFMCSDPGQKLMQDAIIEHELDGVVVAACSPRMHEPTFRQAALVAGLNPFKVQMANIREHCSWVTPDKEAATIKASALVHAAVEKASMLMPLQTSRKEVHQDTLVIGGGIAGIQAAIEIADAGKKVYLVERNQSIGGHMAMLDKTFPTLDCSACILTPKMVTAGKHPNITLLNYSEVEEVAGSVGEFQVKVRRKATGVDASLCTGCGICIEKCPMKQPSEFDRGTQKRKVIYIDFPQAVPNVPVIDWEHCTYAKKGKCKVCQIFCETGAVTLNMEDEILDFTVGNIIVATGFQGFDTDKMRQFGHDRFDNVLDALEFERMVNAAGPTEGHIQLADGSDPESVAIVHCVGSRDVNHHEYCSRVCCMYSVKYAHLLKEKTDAEVFEYYIDMRCFGKGYEEFYKRNAEEGVRFLRAKPGYITDIPVTDEEEGKLVVVAEETTLGKIMRVPVDMVILAQALEARDDTEQVSQMLRISRSSDGFFMERHPKLGPVATATEGIYIAGCCQGPKDIPDTVAQASAAAGAVLSVLSKGWVQVGGEIAEVVEEDCSACKMCISACPYVAITMKSEDEGGRAWINPSLCKGCGTCAAMCPSAAITAHHFTSEQISAEIAGALL